MIGLNAKEVESRPPLMEFNGGALLSPEKKIVDFKIGAASDGSVWGLSILAIRGKQSGPTLLLTGGTHGDEYEGPVAIQELFEGLDPEEVHGTWLGIPVLNEPAMSVPQRCGKYDGQDLARVFPGKPDATLTELIAFAFGQYVLKQADFYIDLHSGGNIFRMVCLAGYDMVTDESVLKKQRLMAVAFGSDFVWGTPSLPGRTCSQAEEFGIPTIYTETTGTGGLKRQDVERYKEGAKNVMRSVGMMEGVFPTLPARYFRETAHSDHDEGYLQIDHPSPSKGLFIPRVDLWDWVQRDEEAGKIVDAAGRTLSTVRARRSGHVVLVRHILSVNEGDPLLVVVENLDR